ncbi:MAG: hypothetical protein H6955_18840 [Chromatiaceae bacterium]|nr:hypothetical protein [Chromatiaceae bacterium]
MKTPKLLKKAEEILSAEKMKRRDKKKSLKDILQKLKKRKRKLVHKLEAEKNKSDKEKIRKHLAVIRAQRKKGLKALKELK